MSALKYFITEYCLSVLNAGAWNTGKQTKKPYGGNMKLTPDYGISNVGVLNGNEGDSSDGFISEKSINKFEIKQKILVEDLGYIIDEGLQQGLEIGLWFKMTASELKWGKGYITSVTISAKDKGSLPEITIKGWLGKLATMSAPTIASASGKPLKFFEINITGQKTYKFEAEIINGKDPIYTLESSFADNYPTDVMPLERTGTAKFTVDTDSYTTYDDLEATANPKVASAVEINIGASNTLTITKLVIDSGIERLAQISKDLQLYEVSGTMATDTTTPCFVYA